MTTTRLEHFATLKADWDSYGALPIDPRAIECARRLLAVMSHEPQMVPTTRGGVQFEWHRDGIDVELDIPPEGAALFFANADDDPLETQIAALTARLTVLEAALRDAHQELYGNASVSVEFAAYDLDPENAPFNLAKVRGLISEARVSISAACNVLARAALGSEGR
jgi:hypothetical protein